VAVKAVVVSVAAAAVAGAVERPVGRVLARRGVIVA
jgi:hypothetical protein